MKISMIPNKIVKLIHASKGDTSLRKWAFEPYDNNGAINVSNIKDQLVYKTENGGTEQLLPVNTSTPTTSYFDGTINYGTDTDVEFTYKQSSYTGQARVKSIKGNTLVWNQLVQNGNFADVTGWSATRGSLSASNNELLYTITSLGSNTTANRINVNVSLVSGHNYLLIGSIYPLHDGNGTLYMTNATSTGSEKRYVGNKWNELSYLATATADGNAGFRIGFNATDYEVNDVVKMRNCMLIDLTILNDSHITDYNSFKTYFPLNYYAYNSGSLLNFNGTGIKTENKDQTDEYTLSLPISTYFPTGMKDNGVVYDELSDKAITRVGSVDLGTLTWTNYGSSFSDLFYSDGLVGITAYADQDRIYDKCAKYEGIVNRNHAGGKGSSTEQPDKTVRTRPSDGRIYIVDSSHDGDTGATFKSAMSGIYLNYELATYTETDIQNASLVCKNIEVPCYLSNGNLVCDATEDLTNESGFFDAKLKIKDSSSVAYSSKFKLHVEDL